MSLSPALYRASLFAALFVLLIAAPAQSQTLLPMPEMPTHAPRAEVKHTLLTHGRYFGNDSLGASLDMSGTGSDMILVAGSRAGYVQIYQHVPNYGLSIAQRIYSPDLTYPTTSYFGASVAVAGTATDATLVIGTSRHAYVYIQTDEGWIMQADLAIPYDPAVWYGLSVDISGTGDDATIVIGASGENRATAGGAVYVFKRTGSTWIQQAKLLPPTPQTEQQFGRSVAIAGTGDNAVIVVGADGYDGTSANAGRAVIYENNGGTWTERTTLENPEPATSPGFGNTVSVVSEGTDYTVAVGADRNVISFPPPGLVAVYDGTPAAVTLNRVFKKSDFAAAASSLGRTARLSGSPTNLILGLGIPQGNTNEGNVTLSMKREAGIWSPMMVATTSSPYVIHKEYGAALSVVGNGQDALLIASNISDPSSGELLLFNRKATGEWTIRQPIQNSGPHPNLGNDVATLDMGSEKIIAAGAPYEIDHGQSSGAVRIYDHIDGAWQETAVFHNPTFEPYTLFGRKVALAATQTHIVLAVSESHQVFVYSRPRSTGGVPGSWSNPIRLTGIGQSFSADIALASTGDRVLLAVGSPYWYEPNDGTHGVHIYEFDGVHWDFRQVVSANGMLVQGQVIDLAIHNGKPILAFTASATSSLGAPERVVVFSNEGDVWTEEARLAPISGDVLPIIPGDMLYNGPLFGSSLSLRTQGTKPMLAVGLVSSFDPTYYQLGAAYIYERSGTAWERKARLQSPEPKRGDGFGMTVSWAPSEEPFLAIGSPGLEDSSLDFEGSVSLYRPIGDEWIRTAVFLRSQAIAWTKFAASLAFLAGPDNFTLIVGQPWYSATYTNQGAIHIYEHLSLSLSGADDLVVTEDGAGDSYTIALPFKPTANVDIVITTDGQCALNGLDVGAALVQTFTPATWNVPQTVTVTAVDDSIIEGLHTCTLSHEVSSADAGYGSLAVAPITVQITDNDTDQPVQPIELLTNGGFEQPLDPAWTVKNATGDKRVCKNKGDGSACAFKFKGGQAEKSSLNQTITLNGTRVTASIFTLSGRISAANGKSLKVKVKTFYADGSTDLYATMWKSTGTAYHTHQSVFAQATDGATRMVLMIVNKNTSGKVWLDDISLTTLAPRSVAPLPEQAPDSFRGQN